jgi:hypothetical protein
MRSIRGTGLVGRSDRSGAQAGIEPAVDADLITYVGIARDVRYAPHLCIIGCERHPRTSRESWCVGGEVRPKDDRHYREFGIMWTRSFSSGGTEGEVHAGGGRSGLDVRLGAAQRAGGTALPSSAAVGVRSPLPPSGTGDRKQARTAPGGRPPRVHGCGMYRPPPAATRVTSAPAAVAGSMPAGAPLFVTGTDGAVPDALSITVASSGADTAPVVTHRSSDGAGSPPAGARTAGEART